MQDQYSSDIRTETSQLSADHNEQGRNIGFTITTEDSEILLEHLDEFQDADTDLRTKIINTAMGRLYVNRPDDASFDKGEARTVHRSSCLLSSS